MMAPRPHRPWVARLSLCALAVGPSVVQAQLDRTEYSVQSRITASDNGAGAAQGEERADLFASVRPGLRFSRQGAQLRVKADIAADMTASARDTQPDRILPDARAVAELTLIERALFLDSSVDLRQVEDDPFGARVAEGAALNTRTVGTLRLSPYVAIAISPRVSALARLDETWTRYKDTLVGDSDTHRAVARLEAKPQPLGWLLEASQEDTDYSDPDESDLQIGRLTVTATTTLAGDWVVGLAAGRERATFDGSTETDSVYGARVYWIPGPRTDVALAIDRRFFGNGWSLSASHRTTRMAVAVRGQREPTAAGTGVRGDGLASFLDAILKARTQDPAQRADLVDGLLTTRELQTSVPGAVGTPASYPQLHTALGMTWVYLGPRTTFSLTGYGEERVRLEHSSAPATNSADNDSRQAGASFGWNHRLTPQTSLDIAATYSRIAGLAARDGELSREALVRANLVRNLTPRMNATLGASTRRLRTNAATANSFDETTAFAGVSYRF